MKRLVLKEWVIYLVTGFLYCLVITRAGNYSELDALIVSISSFAMLITGYWIQWKDNKKEQKKAYERGVCAAARVLNPLRRRTYEEDD